MKNEKLMHVISAKSIRLVQYVSQLRSGSVLSVGTDADITAGQKQSPSCHPDGHCDECR